MVVWLDISGDGTLGLRNRISATSRLHAKHHCIVLAHVLAEFCGLFIDVLCDPVFIEKQCRRHVRSHISNCVQICKLFFSWPEISDAMEAGPLCRTVFSIVMAFF